ncbi:MAG TPA: signal peptidase I [Pseudonocardiaceae bacterium]|nr:signal peptidase I [Pseudonocardiaceae bacterium]
MSVLIGLVAAAIVALALGLTVVPAVAGGHTLTVLSGSMVPTLPVGSVVVDRPVPASSLRVGDIVTYATTDPVSAAPILITHRVIAIRAGVGGPTFITKGDANNVADQRPVTAAQIRGRLWYDVPYVGLVRNALLSRGVGLIAAAVLLLLIGGWVIRRALRPTSRTTEADATSKEDRP